MLLAVFDGINFTTFFHLKICDLKVDKNALNFSKQYGNKKRDFKKLQIKKCNKY